MFEVDGQPFAGSNVILRYVGRLTGLYPSDLVQAARADEIMEIIEEIHQRFFLSNQEKDQAKKVPSPSFHNIKHRA